MKTWQLPTTRGGHFTVIRLSRIGLVSFLKISQCWGYRILADDTINQVMTMVAYSHAICPSPSFLDKWKDKLADDLHWLVHCRNMRDNGRAQGIPWNDLSSEHVEELSTQYAWTIPKNTENLPPLVQLAYAALPTDLLNTPG